MQPSDLFIAVVALAYFGVHGFNFQFKAREVLSRFLHFAIYVTVVNLAVALIRIGLSSKGLPWYVMSSFYYYNLLVMAFAFALYSRYRKDFLRVTIYSLILVAGLQIFLASVLGLGGGGRETLFFTNPNQLGYYGLSALVAVFILDEELKLNPLIIYAAFAMFTYLILESVSKAALGSAAILLVVYLVVNGKFNVRAIASILGILLSLLIIITSTSFGQEFLNNWAYREATSQIEQAGVTQMEYRGYDRILNHPYYLILGAGEGAYNRFDTFIEGHEMHSSVGTIIFCYGIPGTILFGRFLWSLFRGLSFGRILYSLPLFAYGVTHMGLRFTIFWIALILLPITNAHQMFKEKRGKLLYLLKKLKNKEITLDKG